MTTLRKVDFTSDAEEACKIINENGELFDFSAETLNENSGVVDVELIVDENDCVYDYRLWDTYHRLGQNFTYGNGWTNWLMEYGTCCAVELVDQFNALTE